MILVLWHTDETRLELLLGHCNAICTHKINGSSTHLWSSEHARSHELPCHGRLHASPEVHRHVAIFSWGCRINAIHLLLRLHHLLHLHHVLLLENDCHPRVCRLAQLCQFGHLTAISKLLDIILCGQFWGLCTPLIVLDQLLKMSSNLLNLSLLALDLDLLSIDSSVLLVDIAGKLAVLGLEPIKGRLNMCKLLAQLFLLLAHAFIVHLHLTLQRLQLHIEVRALEGPVVDDLV